MDKMYVITTTFFTPIAGTLIQSAIREVDLSGTSDKAEQIQELRDAMQTQADELTDVVGAMGVLNIRITVELVEKQNTKSK